jgi:uncharacterized protein YijF (DUF1287 family)
MATKSKRRFLIGIGFAVVVITAIAMAADLVSSLRPSVRRSGWATDFVARYHQIKRPGRLMPGDCEKVLQRGRELLDRAIVYDPSYVKIPFPNGDVPRTTGVCADIVVRAFRAVGFDLQQAIYDDKSADHSRYPAIWLNAAPDRNIDHRRVPNIMTYLHRNHSALSLERDPGLYRSCDIVAWDLGAGVTHIGLVSNRQERGIPLVIHHISGFPQEQNVLFAWTVIGHFSL